MSVQLWAAESHKRANIKRGSNCNQALSEVGYQLIPEIATIPLLKKQPALLSNKMLKKYSSKDIGASLVERFRVHERQQRLTQRPEHPDPKNKRVRIALAVDDRSIPHIVEKDQFLNYHQTLKTNGDSTLSHRRNIEHHIFDFEFQNPDKIKSEDVVNYVYPKSAFLLWGQMKELDLGKTSPRIGNQYGENFAVLKNIVKDRSLWASSDTLGLSTENIHSFDYKGPIDKAAEDIMGNTYYYEAVIFGELKLSESLDYWMVVDLNKQLFNEIRGSNPSIDAMIRSNRPIYNCKIEEGMGGRWEPVRKQLIWKPEK